MSRNRIIVLVVSLSLLLVACSGEPELGGRWDGGDDWGEVIFVGLQGTYSSTFGPDPGDILVTLNIDDGTYAGTWGEGTARFGTLEFEFKSPNVIEGTWEADPGSGLSGSSGGLLRWDRN